MLVDGLTILNCSQDVNEFVPGALQCLLIQVKVRVTGIGSRLIVTLKETENG